MKSNGVWGEVKTGEGNQGPILCQTLGSAFGYWMCCGCLESPASHLMHLGLLLSWEIQRDDLAFGGVFAVTCAEKCPTDDVKSQGEMQAALGVFPAPELFFLTHVHHCLMQQRCKFLQLPCTLTAQSLQLSFLLCQNLIVMGD